MDVQSRAGQGTTFTLSFQSKMILSELQGMWQKCHMLLLFCSAIEGNKKQRIL